MSRPRKNMNKAEQWKYARGFFVDLILLIVDYVLKCDEELKGAENNV